MSWSSSEYGLAWGAVRCRAGFAVYPRQTLLDKEMCEVAAVVGFDKGVVASRGRTSGCEGETGMNGEGPGQDPFDVRGGLFPEAHDGGGVFEAEMVLLLADAFQFGVGAGGGLQAIHVIESQVQFLPGSLDLETVTVVQTGFNQRGVLDGLKLRSRNVPSPDSIRGSVRKTGISSLRSCCSQTMHLFFYATCTQEGGP